MTKQELNKRMAELYGISTNKTYFDTISDGSVWQNEVMLIDDSARMFDLMIEYNLLLDFAWVNMGDGDLKYYTVRRKNEMGAADIVFVKDHKSEKEAALYAIALKLVK